MAGPKAVVGPDHVGAPLASDRTADVVANEIETQLTISRHNLSYEEFVRSHEKVAALVDELRKFYPNDHRLAKFLPERWMSLNYVHRRGEVDAEIGEVLRTTNDPVLKRDALFLQSCLRINEPIDSSAAVSLAETFTQEWPDDNRAGELLYMAARKLDGTLPSRLFLVTSLVVVGALTAATARKRPARSRRRWPLPLLLGLLGLVMLGVAYYALRPLPVVGQAETIAFMLFHKALESPRLVLAISLVVVAALVAVTTRKRPAPSRRRWMLLLLLGLLGLESLGAVLYAVGLLPDGRQARAIAFMLFYEVSEGLQTLVWTGQAGIAVALAASGALILVVVRKRSAERSMRWTSAVRLWVLGFSAVLAVCCATDACLIARKSALLRQRIVREYPDSLCGRMLQGQVRQRKGIGEPFDLEFADAISGHHVSIKDLRGKVVVVDFWATWCGPCIGEIPEMKRLYAKYHDQGVEFIGVSHDLPEENGGLAALKTFVAKEQIPWPQFYEGRDNNAVLTGSALRDFSESWGIDGIPTVFLIDTDGKLYSTAARGKLDTLLPKLLKMSKASSP